MLPVQLLKNSKNRKISVQIKNGDNINGILENIDNFMNLKIKNITYSDKTGKNFFQAEEIYIRGNSISSINFEEDLLDNIEKEKIDNKNNLLGKKRSDFHNNNRGRGNNKRGRGKFN
jgi:U6 snRNA-associated Sm-like protein LSm4